LNIPSASRGAYGSHRERQRRRILDAAEKLFAERGIDRVTIADIVNAAGIRASTLYEYFHYTSTSRTRTT
jgi:AcrR family transcriptional regulator